MNFAQIPFAVLADKRVSRTDLMIYGVMLFMQGASGELRTSLNRIAERLASESGYEPLDRRRVSEAIGRLELIGIIEKVDYGRGRSKGYRIKGHKSDWSREAEDVCGDDCRADDFEYEGNIRTVSASSGYSENRGNAAHGDIRHDNGPARIRRAMEHTGLVIGLRREDEPQRRVVQLAQIDRSFLDDIKERLSV